MKKIKVLKDTPFDKKYSVLSIKEFRTKYNYTSTKFVSDLELINYLETEYNLEQESPRYGIGSWFKVVETDSFKLGDWVWNEIMQQALYVVGEDTCGEKWYPNVCTINAVNDYPETYKRKATKAEIDLYKLESFCDGKVLIGKHKCWYFDYVWKALNGIENNIVSYFKFNNQLSKITTFEKSWETNFNGLKVGCTSISHEEVLKIAKILKINV